MHSLYLDLCLGLNPGVRTLQLTQIQSPASLGLSSQEVIPAVSTFTVSAG